MSKKQTQHEDSFENVESALSKTEQFIEDNQKLISLAVLAIILVVGGYWAFKKLYMQPMEQNAQKSIFAAQQYFEKDSFNLALNGDGMDPGFLEIIDLYGITEAGNLSQYYAGVSYLHMGNFEEALAHLKNFSTDEPVLSSTANGAMGDAYLELGNQKEAINYYKKAGALDNQLTAPLYLFKLGLLYEKSGDKKEALTAYNKIKNDYSNSFEARQIDKYITRATISQ
jgi:tetratricopeptide (TPR) repeat protein